MGRDIRCYVIDDQQIHNRMLIEHISHTPGLTFVGSETNPLQALDLIVSKKLKVDLVFLDIEMPQISGFAMMGLIRDFTKVILMDEGKGYAFEAFDSDALDYLHKPIAQERFLKAVKKVKNGMLNGFHSGAVTEEMDFIFVKLESKNSIIKVCLEEITYIEGADNYIIIHTVSSRPIITHSTMKSFQEQLPIEKFVRIHKSHIINISHIGSIVGNLVLLANDIRLTIGPIYRKGLFDLLRLV